MSRGFRDSDATQALSDEANKSSIERILELDRDQSERALDRRAHGVQGLCEDCGRAISAERLKALPTATRCLACQSAWEQANRV
jgi:DnaK suppressor protein